MGGMYTLDSRLKNMSVEEFEKLTTLLSSGGFGDIGDTLVRVRKEFNSENRFFNSWHISEISVQHGCTGCDVDLEEIARAVSNIDGTTAEQAMLELSRYAHIDFSDEVYTRVDENILVSCETIEEDAPSLLRGILRVAAKKAFEKDDFESLKGLVSNGWSGTLVDDETGIPLEALVEISPSGNDPLGNVVETDDGSRATPEFALLLRKMTEDIDAEGNVEEKIRTHRKILEMFNADGNEDKDVARALGEYAGKLAALRDLEEGCVEVSI